MIFQGLLGNSILGILGIIVLVYSAEYVVNRLVLLAHHYGVSDAFVGMTAMSIGTSLPEIGSHLVASWGILTGRLGYETASGTVLGANIGSDVIQQTFVLGLVIFIVGGLTFSDDFLKHNYSMMVATTLMCIILGLDGTYSRWDGALLLLVFVWYMYHLYARQDFDVPEKEPLTRPAYVEILLALGGMAVLLGSSYIVLDVTEFVVEQTGLGSSLIGVFSLGLASALPELFTAIHGIREGAAGISLGTLIGSNITNPLVAIGGGSLLSTYFVPKPLVYWDLPMETVTAGLLLLYLFQTDRKLDRWGAAYLMVLYFVYAFVRMQYFAVDVW